MAGAMSEAYIGYDLQNALQEEFANRKLKVNGVAKNLDYILTDGDEIVLYAAVAHSGGDGR